MPFLGLCRTSQIVSMGKMVENILCSVHTENKKTEQAFLLTGLYHDYSMFITFLCCVYRTQVV